MTTNLASQFRRTCDNFPVLLQRSAPNSWCHPVAETKVRGTGCSWAEEDSHSRYPPAPRPLLSAHLFHTRSTEMRRTSPPCWPCPESLTDATSCRRQAGSHISRIGDKNPAISSPIGSEIRNDVEAQKCRVCTSGTAENKKGATFGRLYAGRLPSLGGDAPDVRAHLGAGRRQNTTCVTRGPAIIRADIEGVGPHLLVGNTVIADDAS